MRALFLVPFVALTLAGCSAIARQNGDYFQAGADVNRFQADDQACATRARDTIDYNLTAMKGTTWDLNRAYNAVYGRCMTAAGHAPRPYFRNWLLTG